MSTYESRFLSTFSQSGLFQSGLKTSTPLTIRVSSVALAPVALDVAPGPTPLPGPSPHMTERPSAIENRA